MDERHVAFLLDERVLRVHGDDARTWLQGQVTCDVLLRGPSVHGLVLSATGHVITDVWVLDRSRKGETPELWLRMPSRAFDAALKRLDRFIVMEDVELEPTDLRVIHTLAEPSLPSREAHATPRLAAEGWDVVVSDAEATLAELEREGFTRGDDALYERLRITAGKPRLGPDFGEHTLPQEAGLKSAVSFTKGCYFGQEPVVMLEHRGKPPKRLVHIAPLAPSPAIVVGSAVTDADGREVGTITSAAPEAALALVKRRALEAGELRVNGEPIPTRTVE
jgi:folate-binding protein YgfZ